MFKQKIAAISLLTFSMPLMASSELKGLVEKGYQKAESHKNTLSQELKKFEKQVQKSAQENRNFFEKQQKRAISIADRAVAGAAAASGMVNGTPDKQDMIDAKVDTFVFVSRSMPEDVLMTLFKQGLGKEKTVFVMRGWGYGDVNEAFDWIETVQKKLGDVPSIMIYPQLFDFYRISQVPAVAHQDSNKKWYLIQGALSLQATVEEIKKRNFKAPLSKQWPVSEPDQAKVERDKMSKTDWKKWQQENSKALAQTFLGKLELPYATITESRIYTPYKILDYNVQDRFGKGVIPKGTKINPLDADPTGKRTILFVDGRDPWQVKFTQNLIKRAPKTTVFYTKLGGLSESGIEAYPLNETFRDSFKVNVVPSVYIQHGKSFIVKTYKRK